MLVLSPSPHVVGCIHTTYLANNAFRCKESVKHEFRPIIYSDSFDGVIKLILDQLIELRNKKRLSKKSPCTFYEIINYCEKIMVFINIWLRIWTPNIHVHKLKRWNCSRHMNKKKKKPFLFSFGTSMTCTSILIWVFIWRKLWLKL